ncbi:MAG: polysaccharide deacetylase family protein [Armatimonadetes bacterium]|nr:polysaccharide deacetylase family protein [Armatimonadota bacterium]MDE2207383.1 polysaccharide deacetylase family protein [Armatimonadota bacterium]
MERIAGSVCLMLAVVASGCHSRPHVAAAGMRPDFLNPNKVQPLTSAVIPAALPKVFNGRQRGDEVAVSFDAGSDDSGVSAILSQLQQHGYHATFFLTGVFCKKYPAACREIAEAGMEIGSHSYSHPHFTKLTDAQVLQQLTEASSAIRRATGAKPSPLFRFPYGDCDKRTLKLVAKAGYQPIGWALDSLDAFQQRKTPAFIANRFRAKLRAGDITLMHVACPESGHALGAIFDWMGQHHWRQVTVGQLLRDHRFPNKHSQNSRVSAV